jgi:hypothetical protein
MTRQEWHKLNYTMCIRRLSAEEGGGWIAWIPALGKGVAMHDGVSPNEAIHGLEIRRKLAYDDLMKSGVEIPLPEED